MNVIKVTPEAFEPLADSFKAASEEFRTSYEEMKKVVIGTARYWMGDAADAYRELFLENDEKMREIHERLSGYPEQLLQMQSNYKAAEEKSRAAASQSVSSHLID